jgi:hypothetical protein
MTLRILTTSPISHFTVTDLDRRSFHTERFDMPHSWHRISIPCARNQIKDITIHGESIRHCLNSGTERQGAYDIWLNGDLAELFGRVSDCIAHDDLMKFKDLSRKYLITESWNEYLEGEFIPLHVKQFFAKGDGPHWYHKDDTSKLPYITYEGTSVNRDFDLSEDLTFVDTKFHGQGSCRSLKPRPVLPTIKTTQLKNTGLQQAMEQFGFSELLQVQHVELQPNSVLPVHKDDFTYEDGRHIIEGPSQLYFVLTGDSDNIKFKFKNVGLLDVGKPLFINNRGFVHSLIYTGTEPRGVLLAYGVRSR